MTFRLTDDFAEMVCNCLEGAHKTLEDRAINPKRESPTLEELTSAAMVHTMADIIRANIGNDKPVKKETVKTDAIKSV